MGNRKGRQRYMVKVLLTFCLLGLQLRVICRKTFRRDSQPMPEYLAPGVYIEEVPFKSHPIPGVPTSTAAFIDIFEQGPIDKAVKIDCFADFERVFGGLHRRSEASYAIRQYYLNGGRSPWVGRVDDSSPQEL